MALRVYFDGAGKDDQHPIITVGGFLAESAICEQIETEWQDATRNRPFHLREFGAPSCKLESSKWTGDDRRAFLNRLAAIVNRPGCYIVSSTVEVAPFREKVKAAVHPNEIGPAFSGCAYSAVAMAEYELIKDGRMNEQMRYVFEKGDRETEITQLFRDLDRNDSQMFGLRGHAFEPKSTTLLQPADLIAGMIQRCLIRAYEPMKCLDNGKAKTPLANFVTHYDDATRTLVAGHDEERCVVMNPMNFTALDKISKTFFEVNPDQLPKRKKQLPYKP